MVNKLSPHFSKQLSLYKSQSVVSWKDFIYNTISKKKFWPWKLKPSKNLFYSLCTVLHVRHFVYFRTTYVFLRFPVSHKCIQIHNLVTINSRCKSFWWSIEMEVTRTCNFQVTRCRGLKHTHFIFHKLQTNWFLKYVQTCFNRISIFLFAGKSSLKG